MLDLELLPDGKILAVGMFNQFNGLPQNKIVRLNSDGTLDTTFEIGSGFNQWVNDVEVDSNGRCVIGGTFTEFNGTSVTSLIRLNTNGSIDITLNQGSVFLQAVFTSFGSW